ncbi:hypothetical protein E2562_024984 [Oryza meyeriana var. granulata]|uniref:Uncharacterized protein n=1 Tax=Oryza meyeriana var. granulata TaxID=110450 RepID=A0A6G1FBZ9_9ORYZ|nr:hypothetical protein E2562_024984 [Oryza meyeriana var. granulata]
MRIRRAASRVLGSAYFTTQAEASHASMSILAPPPPTPVPMPAAYGGSSVLDGPVVALDGACQLNQSPWDLPCELDDPNPRWTSRLVL